MALWLTILVDSREMKGKKTRNKIMNRMNMMRMRMVVGRIRMMRLMRITRMMMMMRVAPRESRRM